ncbi:MAG: polysaccharide pyruvyl transferase family protein [Candidatus Aminicenantes bacterium]|nr:polysaccharide pyruvyl transferase family protein [Candidatus Aminicenantes bacterium]
MSEPLRLVHLANFNSTNIGNGALISGLEHIITADFPSEITWIREPWDDYSFGFRKFDHRFVDLINSCAGLIVNGAVAIHGRNYLQETGMRFELPLTLINEIKKPIVFYGISYRHFKGQPFYHQETLRKTLAFLSEKPNVFLGVRNDGTKKWLKETLLVPDISLEKIHEIPDSGVFVQAQSGIYPEVLPERRVVIFSPNNEDAPCRYGEANFRNVKETGYRLSEEVAEMPDSVWGQNRAGLILAIKNALTRILHETGAQLLLVPHYFDDLKFIADLVDAFHQQVAHQTTITTGLMRVPGTAYFYGRYLAADLAVSMRVHSMSPCIGLGVPMIPLVTQPRMWDFLTQVGLCDLALNAFSEDLESQLALQCLQILENPGDRRERFLQAKTKMREDVRMINSKLFNLFQD